MKKFKGMKIMYSLKNNNIIICYAQWDIGGKYKIYKKDEYNNYRYVYAEDGILKAFNYANKIYVKE